MKYLSVMLLAGILVLSAGCDQPPQVPTVDRVDVFTPMHPIKLVGQLGAAGVETKVFLYHNRQQPQTVLGQGTLEMMIFDGRAPLERLGDFKPLKTWSYTPQELMQYRAKTLGLWNYRLTLLWGENVPKESVVTILAKYMEPNGNVLYSAPVYMNVN